MQEKPPAADAAAKAAEDFRKSRRPRLPMSVPCPNSSRVGTRVEVWAGRSTAETAVSQKRNEGAQTALLRRPHLLDVDEAAGLALPQRRVMAVHPQQFGVRALLDDAAVVEHHQPVHAGDGGEPVR